MTWQIVNSIPYDPAVSDMDQQVLALKYFFDTFLPTKGWTVGFRNGEDTSSNFRVYQRDFTDTFTGNSDKHYLWINMQSAQYEDATYTTTPGDKGTDTTNSQSFAWYSTSEELSQHSFKFWESTENPKAFLVTRWDSVLAWDPGIDWPTYKPKDSLETGPSIDRWETCVFLPLRASNATARMYLTNLPTNTNATSSESIVSMGPQENSYVEGSQNGFFDLIEFRYGSSSATAFWRQPDVRWFNYYTGSSMTFPTAEMTKILPVQVNNGDYWLFTQGSKTISQIALNIGSTVPDFN